MKEMMIIVMVLMLSSCSLGELLELPGTEEEPTRPVVVIPEEEGKEEYGYYYESGDSLTVLGIEGAEEAEIREGVLVIRREGGEEESYQMYGGYIAVGEEVIRVEIEEGEEIRIGEGGGVIFEYRTKKG